MMAKIMYTVLAEQPEQKQTERPSHSVSVESIQITFIEELLDNRSQQEVPEKFGETPRYEPQQKKKFKKSFKKPFHKRGPGGPPKS